jgi:hypothetical protein
MAPACNRLKGSASSWQVPTSKPASTECSTAAPISGTLAALFDYRLRGAATDTPMTPPTPTKPTQTAPSADSWWPPELGIPASAGSAPEVRYAYFPQKRRLVIERGQERTTYDMGDHQFRGALQSSTPGGALTFMSQHGRTNLDVLATV